MNTCLYTLQSSAGGSGGKGKEEVVLQLAIDFATKLPPPFDLELATYKYPVTYLESMNSVLHQEMIRFNRLTDVSNIPHPGKTSTIIFL